MHAIQNGCTLIEDICDICFQPGKRGMNDGYFAFKQQSYKKLTNLERAEIIRSDEVYSNTCIINVPKMCSPSYKTCYVRIQSLEVYGDNSLG